MDSNIVNIVNKPFKSMTKILKCFVMNVMNMLLAPGELLVLQRPPVQAPW